MTEKPILIGLKQAAQMASLSTRTIRRLLDDDTIPSVYQGRRRLIRLEDFQEWIDSLE